MNQPRSAPARGIAAASLVALVVGIIAVAFRSSWGALRDAALAAHFDRTAAFLYPFGVDGLIIIAIIAAVLLRHDPGARRYCLAVVAGFTGASWLLNFLHGLGTFSPDPVTEARAVPDWPVVVVIASLVIGSIFLGSHLLVYVWRHLFPDAAAPPATTPPLHADQAGTPPYQAGTPVPESPAAPPDNFSAAKLAYRESLAPGLQRLSQAALMERFQITKREAARVQFDVKTELAGELTVANGTETEAVPPPHTPNGHGPAAYDGAPPEPAAGSS